MFCLSSVGAEDVAIDIEGCGFFFLVVGWTVMEWYVQVLFCGGLYVLT